MTPQDLTGLYHGYIDCLNRRDWDDLPRFVAEDVRYNGALLGLAGYRAMLVADVRAIPDVRFTLLQLVCEPPVVAVRLGFDCTPTGLLFGLPVNGRRVQFSENVFYDIAGGRIGAVWSVIDKAAVAAQIGAAPSAG
ncbi:MAG: ester cyclase [Salipiger marinus]|uniref:ester cyclase n=1 Tax=Salipiger marinus TaxID=555512 RepID=UPI004059A580